MKNKIIKMSRGEPITKFKNKYTKNNTVTREVTLYPENK